MHKVSFVIDTSGTISDEALHYRLCSVVEELSERLQENHWEIAKIDDGTIIVEQAPGDRS